LAILSHYSRPRFDEFLPVVAVPMAAFWALPWFGRRFARDRTMWLSSAAALVVHFALLYPMAQPVWGDLPLGAAAVGCGFCSLLMLRRARSVLPPDAKDRLHLSAAFGATTLLFVTASVPILVN